MSRRGVWRLGLFGLLAYAAMLAWTFPAQRAYDLWQASARGDPQIRLGAIEGTVWAGRAATVSVYGVAVQDLHWRLQPAALVTGKIGAAWRLSLPTAGGAPATLQGSVQVGPGGELVLRAVAGRLPAATIAALAQVQALKPAGVVSLDLAQLRWDGQRVVSASGRLVWQGAAIHFMRPLALGDLSLTLETQGRELRGQLADGGGPLAAEGVARLQPDGGYQISGAFGARPGQPGASELAIGLNALGRPRPDGKVRVNLAGRIPGYPR